MKSPQAFPLRAPSPVFKRACRAPRPTQRMGRAPRPAWQAKDDTIMQRIACALIGSALLLITALVALLLSDALAPGRVPPMLCFWAACGAGGMLLGGLGLLEFSSRHVVLPQASAGLSYPRAGGAA